MKTKLFLHVGTHKTGTTYIQNFMHYNREYLSRHGLIYADYNDPKLNIRKSLELPVSHHHFARSVKDTDKILSESDGKQLVKYWEQTINSSNSLLVSAESFSFHNLSVGGPVLQRREAYHSKLRDWLINFDVTPVLVVRAPDDYMRSLFEEKVTKGFGKSFGFERFVRDFNVPGNMSSYIESVDMFEHIFGNILLVDYGYLREDQAYARKFFELMGFPVDHDVTNSWKDVKKRESPGIIKSLLKSHINSEIQSPRQNAEVIEWLSNDRELNEQVNASYPNHDYNVWKQLPDHTDILDQKKTEIEELIPRFYKHEPIGLSDFLRRDMSNGTTPYDDEALLRYVKGNFPQAI